MVCRAVWTVKSDLEEFVDKNADADEDDYDFEFAGQGIRSGPYRATRNVNFHGMGNYEDVDVDFQGQNDPEAYCHNYSEQKEVKLVVIQFMEYVWWD